MMAFIGGLCIQGRDRASSSLSSRSVRRSVEVTEKPVSVSLVPLGCPKNTVDAEVMLGDLEQQGISVLDDESSADVIIVNTCGFIEDAKRESIEAILAAAELKQGSTTKGIVVTGCLAQRYVPAQRIGRNKKKFSFRYATPHIPTCSRCSGTLLSSRKSYPLDRSGDVVGLLLDTLPT
mmetsp:Transcript_22467/g.90098  ORF Transcript_22467/g.90098 Transcript_22467/m.90098 type:complete len:178 (+) Transcript_22467:55-588(+)